ncbi:MAG: efflux RND transporter permease subunit [Stellaceae bacterium]|jgi:multidrug efflux pump
MKGFNLSEWAINHRSFVWYLMLLFVVAGVFSYRDLGREEDPTFSIKTMIVETAWPGATIDDTMLQITDRIEKKLQETPYLYYLKSYTKPGISTIYVNVLDTTPKEAIPDIWYQVRKKVADIKGTLPQGVVGPNFNDEFGDVFGIVYAFTADGFTHRELRDYVETIRTEILTVKNAAKTQLLGAQDQKFYLEFDTHQLAGLGVSRDQIVQSLREQNAVTPSGVVQTSQEKFAVRVSGSFNSINDLKRINFFANGKFFRLADVATIQEGYSDPPQPIFRFDGELAIGLAISMAQGGNNLVFGEAVAHRMAEITANLPIGIEPHLVADQSIVVEEAVGGFTKALWEAIAIVLAVSFLSLGLRAGVVVACSIPLVLGMVFVYMEYSGISLQRISLGALIIALGLLVDDAMITIEMMVSQLEAGVDREHSATHAWVTTAFPMLTGTLVTVAGFVPIGFAKSGAGEYCYSLFAVIAVALLASWIVAVLFAPVIGVTILPKSIKAHDGGHREPSRFMRMFRRTLLFCMRARWLVIAATLGLFAASLYGFGFIQQQFFPASDRPELLVDLTLPQDASIYKTEHEVERFEKLLKDDPNIDHYSFYVGQGAIRFYLPLNVQLRNDYFAQAVVVTKGLREREVVRARLQKALDTDFGDLNSRISALELGPPVGWPLQYRVSGTTPEGTREAAFLVAQTIGQNPSTRLINFDWNEPMKSLRVQVDQDRVRQLGVSSKSLADALNAVTTGMVITQVRDSIYLTDLTARAADEQRESLQTLRNLQVALDNGQTIPLSQVATVQYGLEQPVIWRRDLLSTITVQADVASGIEAKTVNTELAPALAELEKKLPAGFRIEAGGTVEESAKGLRSIAVIFPMMIFLMLTILMVQLQSFQKMFLVLSVGPLGLIGVVLALLPTGTPMGFVAILGIIALSGMIIRNSVILVDQIDMDLAKGLHPWDAVVDATSHRLRPIVLTAAAASLGMIPIAPEVFWGPMAYAIIGGLFVATLLTLLFLPALYVAWFRIKEPARERELGGEERATAVAL